MSTSEGTANGVQGNSAFDQRRFEITAAAAQLFADEGAGRVNMTQIASAVELAKPTLYHYFSTKDQILYAIHEQTIGFLTAKLESRKGSGPVARLRGLFVDSLALVDQFPGYARVVFEELRHLKPELRRQVVENQSAYSAAVHEIVRSGQDAGVFRGGDPHLIVLALFGMINWTHQWYSPSGAHTPEEIADSFFTLFAQGILADSELLADSADDSRGTRRRPSTSRTRKG